MTMHKYTSNESFESKSNKKSPHLTLAIWEVAYKNEEQAFNQLLVKKAKRIKTVERIDFFGLEEKEAFRRNRELEILSYELNIMYGYFLHVCELKEAYRKSCSSINDAYSRKEKEALCRLKKIQNEMNLLFGAFESSRELAKQYLEIIVAVKKELKERGIQLWLSKNEGE